jgi:hypothetical protein
VSSALAASSNDDRPEIPAQIAENIESAPAIVTTWETEHPAESSRKQEESADLVLARRRTLEMASPSPTADATLLGIPFAASASDNRPENPPQDVGNVQFAPGNGCAAIASVSGGTSDLGPPLPNPIGFRPIKLRMTLNGVMAC